MLLNGSVFQYPSNANFSYLSERLPKKQAIKVRPVMWVRGDTYSEKMEPVHRDVLPIPEELEN